MNTLVIIKDNDIFTDSLIIARGTGNEHNSITRLIRNYTNDFRELGKIEFMDLKSNNPNGGRPIKLYLLNEMQTTLLMTYLENSEVIRKFKLELVKQFYKMRQLLLEKQTEQWQQTRLQSKANRRLETDEIKELIKYAKSQGSKNMEKQGYVIYSKLANKVCGISDRNNATVSQLNNLVLVENILKNCIKNGIEGNKHYKEIYQDCKNRLNQFLEITYLKIAG